MVTETEKQITDYFLASNLEKDDCIGFMAVIRAAKAQDEMLEWLKANPEARYEEMLDKITEIWERI